MFVHVIAPDPGAEIVTRVIAGLYPAILKQDPKDRVYTLSVIRPEEQHAFDLNDQRTLSLVVSVSPIVQVVCWQARGFFDADPAVDQRKRIAARDALMENFSNFSVAMWYAGMEEFAIAPPRHGA